MNITNGKMLSDFLIKHDIDSIPFNETCMCGPITEKVFDDEFISKRVEFINDNLFSLTKDQYINELDEILNLDFNQELVLWFDTDLFCQVNCLVLLVYLKQNNVKKVQLNIVEQFFFDHSIDEIIINAEEIVLDDSIIELFKNINNPDYQSPIQYFNNFCDDYNNYEKEISLFLKENQGCNNLVALTIDKFKKYGITDLNVEYIINTKNTSTINL